MKAKPIAFISGGSSGIGFEIARLLAADGYRLVISARGEERLAEAKRVLASEANAEVFTEGLDVADESACAEAIARVEAKHGTIDWLITSAGIVEPGFLIDQDAGIHHHQMQVNYFGTLALVRAALPAMIKAGKGRITLISSAAAFTGIAGYSSYCASKFAVRALGEALYGELAGTGISVSVAFPPDTDTPQYQGEQAAKPEATKLITAGGGVMSALSVAIAIVKQAKSGRFMITPGWLMTLFGVLHSIYAPLFLWRQAQIISRLAKRAAGRDDKACP